MTKYQWQHGFDLRGVDGATLVNVSVTGVFGDDVVRGEEHHERPAVAERLRPRLDRHPQRPHGDLDRGRPGRHGARGDSGSEPAFTTFDIQPNRYGSGADRVLIEDTTVGPEGRFRGTELRLRGGLISTGSVLAMIGAGPIFNGCATTG